MTPDEIMCRDFLTMVKGVARVWFGKYPHTPLPTLSNSVRASSIISLEDKDTKSQLDIFLTSVKWKESRCDNT